MVTRRDVLVLGFGSLLGSLIATYSDTILGRLTLGLIAGVLAALCIIAVDRLHKRTAPPPP